MHATLLFTNSTMFLPFKRISIKFLWSYSATRLASTSQTLDKDPSIEKIVNVLSGDPTPLLGCSSHLCTDTLIIPKAHQVKACKLLENDSCTRKIDETNGEEILMVKSTPDSMNALELHSTGN